ncbi:hypothetical protein C8R46DRAFT_1049781 [Mycena filopes]|nr:hypothetical protein C8R46DRAFT_1049781 [Mycena filopes]
MTTYDLNERNRVEPSAADAAHVPPLNRSAALPNSDLWGPAETDNSSAFRARGDPGESVDMRVGGDDLHLWPDRILFCVIMSSCTGDHLQIGVSERMDSCKSLRSAETSGVPRTGLGRRPDIFSFRSGFGVPNPAKTNGKIVNSLGSGNSGGASTTTNTNSSYSLTSHPAIKQDARCSYHGERSAASHSEGSRKTGDVRGGQSMSSTRVGREGSEGEGINMGGVAGELASGDREDEKEYGDERDVNNEGQDKGVGESEHQ